MQILGKELALLDHRSLTIEGTETNVVVAVHTFNPEANPLRALEHMTPLVSYLQTHLGTGSATPLLFDFYVHTTYSNALAGLLERKVDLMPLDPVSYVRARRQDPSIMPLVQQSYAGQPEVQGAIFVRADSPITSLEALRGKSFAFGSEGSAVGSCLPKAALLAAGLHASDLRTTNASTSVRIKLVREGVFQAWTAGRRWITSCAAPFVTAADRACADL